MGTGKEGRASPWRPGPSSRELPEEALLGDRLDSHDWEKISNVNVSWGRAGVTACRRPGGQGHGSAPGGQASLWPLDLPRRLRSGAQPAARSGRHGLACRGSCLFPGGRARRFRLGARSPDPTPCGASPGRLVGSRACPRRLAVLAGR